MVILSQSTGEWFPIDERLVRRLGVMAHLGDGGASAGPPSPYTGPNGSGKLMSANASSEPWGLAWHRRMPSSSPKPTAKVFRAF